MKKQKETTGSKRNGCIIKPCNCTSIFQDEKYGQGLRVFNLGGSKESTKYICTVCDRKI